MNEFIENWEQHDEPQPTLYTVHCKKAIGIKYNLNLLKLYLIPTIWLDIVYIKYTNIRVSTSILMCKNTVLTHTKNVVLFIYTSHNEQRIGIFHNVFDINDRKLCDFITHLTETQVLNEINNKGCSNLQITAWNYY